LRTRSDDPSVAFTGRGLFPVLLGAALILAATSGHANNGKGNGGEENDRGRSNDRGTSGAHGNGTGRDGAPGQLRTTHGQAANPDSGEVPIPDGGLSRPLTAYRGAVLVARDAVAVQHAAAAEYQTLIGLSRREISQIYPNGGYNAALERARVHYEQTTTRARSAQAAAENALRDVTGGRSLTSATQTELHRRLGL